MQPKISEKEKNVKEEKKSNFLSSELQIKLKNLIKSIKNWTYEPDPVQIILPKKDKEKLKHIACVAPSLSDIILLTALKLLIESECKSRIFNNQGFGFISNRSLHQALHSVKRMVGVTWMIEGKIKNYFENIDINILGNIIKNKLNPDKTLMGIFRKILKARYIENPYIQEIGGGGIISSLLYNLYLTPLDDFIEKLKVKYAGTPHPRLETGAGGLISEIKI